MRNCEPSREIRIYNVSGAVYSDVKNIAAHTGVAMNKQLKPLLSKIADSFPDHMKADKPCEPCVEEIRIRGVSTKVKKELENVAKYLNIDMSDLLTMELAKYSESQPAHMKTEMNNL